MKQLSDRVRDVTEDPVDFDQPAAFQLQTRKGSDIEPKEVQWLWPYWAPQGMITLFAGRGGSGKTTVALQCLAGITRGSLFPDGQRAPLGNVMIMASEDSAEYTLVPRLIQLGADLDRVFFVEGVARTGGDLQWIQLKAHSKLIEEGIIENDIVAFLIDPVSSFIGDANTDKESDVRTSVGLLVGIAERTGCSFILIRHMSKMGDGATPSSRVLGSTTWVDLPRAVWMIADAPDEHQPERGEDGMRDTKRVLAVVKSNLAAKPPARMALQPVDGPLRWFPEASEITIDECFQSAQFDRKATTRSAEIWLTERLKSGYVESRVLFSEAEDKDFNEKLLRKALRNIKAESFQIPGKVHGGHAWRLPNGEPTSLSPSVPVNERESEKVMTRSNITSLSSDGQERKRIESWANSDSIGDVAPPSRTASLASLSHFPHRENRERDSDDDLSATGTDGKVWFNVDDL